jgi:hypothetical protein
LGSHFGPDWCGFYILRFSYKIHKDDDREYFQRVIQKMTLGTIPALSRGLSTFLCERRIKMSLLTPVVTFVGFLFLTWPVAHADQRPVIVSINGQYSVKHKATLTVYPGDTVSLSPDTVDFPGDNAEANAQSENTDNFSWSVQGTGQKCDPSTNNCTGSGFTPSAYGVTFDVPYSMGPALTIVLDGKTGGASDELTLLNGTYAPAPSPTPVPATAAPAAEPAPTVAAPAPQQAATPTYSSAAAYSPPTTAYSDPSDYYSSTSYFDYSTALAGHGRWVYIAGSRVFVPYTYQMGWQPYRHGYWYWTIYGWTWQSHDPWGWVTDHYGFWRYHGTFGWVWNPFPKVRWYPAVVSWWYNSQGIGWSPYWGSYSAGYSHGYAQGYRDGFWLGYQAGLNSNYMWGGTYVSNNHFLSGNIYSVTSTTSTTTISTYYSTSYSSGYYGSVLGVSSTSTTYTSSLSFVSSRVGYTPQLVPTTTYSRSFVGGGNVALVAPTTKPVLPTYYAQVHDQAALRVKTGTYAPVGSVIAPSGQMIKPAPGLKPGYVMPSPSINTPAPVVTPPVMKPAPVAPPSFNQPPVMKPAPAAPNYNQPPVFKPAPAAPNYNQPPVFKPAPATPNYNQPPVFKPAPATPNYNQPPVFKPAPATPNYNQPPVFKPAPVGPPTYTQPPVVKPNPVYTPPPVNYAPKPSYTPPPSNYMPKPSYTPPPAAPYKPNYAPMPAPMPAPKPMAPMAPMYKPNMKYK